MNFFKFLTVFVCICTLIKLLKNLITHTHIKWSNVCVKKVQLDMYERRNRIQNFSTFFLAHFRKKCAYFLLNLKKNEIKHKWNNKKIIHFETDRRRYYPGPMHELITTENYQQLRFHRDQVALLAFHACCCCAQTCCPISLTGDHPHSLASILPPAIFFFMQIFFNIIGIIILF